MKKNISIIGTVGIPAQYGGFETLTEHLVQDLSEQHSITVYCSNKAYSKQLDRCNGAKLVYIPLKANGVQSIPYDIISILKALRHSDSLLILGISGCFILPLVKLFSSKHVIVNIDGLEWKRQKWSKYAKLFLKLSEKLAVKYADVVITDNKVIQEYVQNEYGKKSKLIAYGADHVKRLNLSESVLNDYPFLNKPFAFSVCRIEPENNLHIIIEAMSKQSKIPLVIIGNWDNNSYGKELRKSYTNINHIHLIDPIYNQEILNQIRSSCYIYLHGHSAGGTNPSLVEAMYLGLPIFAYDVDYNHETTEHCSSYFSTAAELTNLVNEATVDTLTLMGQKMAEIARRRYRWKIISEKYNNLF